MGSRWRWADALGAEFSDSAPNSCNISYATAYTLVEEIPARGTQRESEMSTTTTLNSMIRYDAGTITVIESLDEPHEVADAEIVETGCKGWGESNAVERGGAV